MLTQTNAACLCQHVRVSRTFCFLISLQEMSTCSTGGSSFHNAEVELLLRSPPDAAAGTGSDEAERRQPHSARRHRTSQETQSGFSGDAAAGDRGKDSPLFSFLSPCGFTPTQNRCCDSDHVIIIRAPRWFGLTEGTMRSHNYCDENQPTGHLIKNTIV